MKKILKEFRDFAVRGNVIDMAVGVIIGGAFTKIVNSLVSDIIMPALGLLTGDIDFAELKYVLSEAVLDTDGVTVLQEELAIRYGMFLDAILNFILIAICIFAMVKTINTIRTKAEAKNKVEEAPAAPTTKVCPFCKSEIAIEATRCAHCTSELPKEE